MRIPVADLDVPTSETIGDRDLTMNHKGVFCGPSIDLVLWAPQSGAGKTHLLRRIAVLIEDEGYYVDADYEANRLFIRWKKLKVD